MRFGPLLLILFTSLLSLSCAYRFGYVQRDLPGGYKLVAIPTFKNTTQQVGVEVPFTNELIRQFNRSQVAQVVSRSKSEVVLEGEVRSIEYRPTSIVDGSSAAENRLNLPQNTVLAVEYQVVVNTHLVLRQVKDQAVLWEGTFGEESIYAAPQIGVPIANSANPLYNHAARMEVFEVMAKDMMAEAHDRMTENF